MTVLGAVGCPDDRRAQIERGGEDRNAAPKGSGEIQAEAPFQWPESVDHPVIDIEVELPGRRGTIAIELAAELAPHSVERVLALTRKGYYDGTTFHRVIPGFMIQGGDPNSRDRDPTNDGRGGDPSPIPDERSAAPFERGLVALANRGQKDSSTAQLFIMQATHHELDGRYNAIGRVVAGLEVVDAIAAVETDSTGRWGPKNRPIENVYLRRVSVVTESPIRDANATTPTVDGGSEPAENFGRDPRRKRGVL